MEIIAGKDDRDRFSLPDTGLRYLPFSGGDLNGLKIAWSQDLGYVTVDPQVSKATGAAVKVFETVGATVEIVDLKLKNPSEIYATMKGMSFVSLLQDKMEEWGDKIDPHLALLIQQHKDRPAADFFRASRQREEFWNQIQPLFDKYDLLLTPTVAILPVRLDEITSALIAGIKGSTFNWMSFAYPFNLTGQPAASVPCGWTDNGLPIGLEIIGRRFDEITVLKAALAFEEALPWADKRPPLD
jgi:aspartyl-tRNA(Asn)/glutamyl-tRNA(Gln) amidotransferase subunit A